MKRVAIVICIVVVLACLMTGCEEETHVVTFYDGESIVETLTAQDNEEIKFPASPVKMGYIFDGWYIDDGVWEIPLTPDYFKKNKIKSDISVYAKWTKEVYYATIKYETGIDGVEIANEKYEKGKAFSPPLPVVDGYNFLGWYTDEARLIPFKQGAVDKDLTLFAKFLISEVAARQKVEITVYYNNLTSDKAAINVYQGEYFSEGNPIYVGYIFSGYYLDKDFKTQFDLTSVITHPFTLYVRWMKVADRYTVEFDTAGGGAIESYKGVPYNALLREPVEPERAGYKFIGWYLDGDLFDFKTYRVSKSITLTAAWEVTERARYEVTYVFNNGEEAATEKFYVGDAPSLPEPKKTNAVFDGWYVNENLTEKYTQKSESGDFILYAKWRETVETSDFELESGGVNDGYVITAYKGNVATVVIPAEVNGVNITEIGERAFAESDVINVTVPDSLVRINREAFYNCQRLNEFVAGNASRLEYVGDQAFALSSLLSFTVRSDSIVYIGKNAFEQTELSVLTLYGTEAEIDENAFYRCGKLSGAYLSGIASIGNGAFEECGALVNVKAEECETIGARAFRYCIKLESVEIGSCRTLGAETFMGDVKLSSVTVAALESVAPKAFMNATALPSITLTGVKTIMDKAFANCSSLEEITLGIAFESIAYDSFEYAPKIQFSIAENPAYSAINRSLVKNGNILYCVGGITDGEYVIPNGMVSADDVAFQEGNGIIRLTVPAGFTDFGAMMGLSFLGSVKTFNLEGESEFSIRNGNLYKGDKLMRYVDMEDKVSFTLEENADIAVGAFSGCKFLTDVYVGDNATNIGAYVFYNCGSLVEVHNAERIVTFGFGCFYMCSNLSEITFGPNVQVEEFAFEGTRIPLSMIP